MTVTLRPEEVAGHDAPRALNHEAFDPYGGAAELVDALRESRRPGPRAAPRPPRAARGAAVHDRLRRPARRMRPA